jgi:hypothetical protein
MKRHLKEAHAMSSSKRLFIVFGSIIGGLALLTAIMLVSTLRSMNRARAQREATRPVAKPTQDPTETNRRLFLEEHRLDDNARAYIFHSTLRKAGERCDDVQSATMTARGRWTVRCPPGHVFVFKFDENGELESASKLQ